MADFRRTLPLPPPGRFVGDVLQGKTPSLPPQGMRRTPAPVRRTKTHPPTPSRPSGAAGAARSLPPPGGVPIDVSAPEWAKKGRALSTAIEAAIRQGTATRQLELAIERAHGAFTLEGVSEPQLARVAHLIHRAHGAIRASRSTAESAYEDCARVLHAGLPSVIRRRAAIELVVEIVRQLRLEEDTWQAVVEATTWLLGWSDMTRVRAAHAIRQALETYPRGVDETD
jgi:hypothetical protein